MKRAGEGPLDPSFEVRDKERLLSLVYLMSVTCFRGISSCGGLWRWFFGVGMALWGLLALIAAYFADYFRIAGLAQWISWLSYCFPAYLLAEWMDFLLDGLLACFSFLLIATELGAFITKWIDVSHTLHPRFMDTDERMESLYQGANRTPYTSIHLRKAPITEGLCLLDSIKGIIQDLFIPRPMRHSSLLSGIWDWFPLKLKGKIPLERLLLLCFLLRLELSELKGTSFTTVLYSQVEDW
jgi:hypothetical protein